MNTVERKLVSKKMHFYLAITGRTCDHCKDSATCHWRVNQVGETEIEAPPKPCHRCKLDKEQCTISGNSAVQVAFPMAWKKAVYLLTASAPINPTSASGTQVTSTRPAQSAQRGMPGMTVTVVASTPGGKMAGRESLAEHSEDSRTSAPKSPAREDCPPMPENPALKSTTAFVTPAPKHSEARATVGATAASKAPLTAIPAATEPVQHVESVLLDADSFAPTGVYKMCDILGEMLQLLRQIDRRISRPHSPPSSSQSKAEGVFGNDPLRGGSIGPRGQRRPHVSDGEGSDEAVSESIEPARTAKKLRKW